MVEHSTRAREVTEDVAMVVVNDQGLYNLARSITDPDELGAMMRELITDAAEHTPLWYLRQDLSPNDIADRIDWAEVIRQASDDA